MWGKCNPAAPLILTPTQRDPDYNQNLIVFFHGPCAEFSKNPVDCFLCNPVAYENRTSLVEVIFILNKVRMSGYRYVMRLADSSQLANYL